jgi:hypothetical protein
MLCPAPQLIPGMSLYLTQSTYTKLFQREPESLRLRSTVRYSNSRYRSADADSFNVGATAVSLVPLGLRLCG